MKNTNSPSAVSQPISISAGSRVREYFTALPIRFAQTWRSIAASASHLGQRVDFPDDFAAFGLALQSVPDFMHQRF